MQDQKEHCYYCLFEIELQQKCLARDFLYLEQQNSTLYEQYHLKLPIHLQEQLLLQDIILFHL